MGISGISQRKERVPLKDAAENDSVRREMAKTTKTTRGSRPCE